MTRRHTRGFSLIEVVMSVAVISIITVATSLLMQRIPIDGREVRDQDLALKIALNEIETLRAQGYDAIPASGTFTNSLLSSLASSTGSRTVTTWSAKTKNVAITVSWRGNASSTRSVSLTTLVTQNSTLK